MRKRQFRASSAPLAIPAYPTEAQFALTRRALLIGAAASVLALGDEEARGEPPARSATAAKRGKPAKPVPPPPSQGGAVAAPREPPKADVATGSTAASKPDNAPPPAAASAPGAAEPEQSSQVGASPDAESQGKPGSTENRQPVRKVQVVDFTDVDLEAGVPERGMTQGVASTAHFDVLIPIRTHFEQTVE